MPPDPPPPIETGRTAGRWVRRAESRGIRPGEVGGLILAGGRSSRMGTEKALLRIGGETLIERQLRTLRDIGVREVFLSLRPDLVSSCAFAPPDPVVLLDKEEGLGPLAGIVSAMAYSPERHLLVLAVDMPGVRSSLLWHMFSHASLETGVAPKVGGMWEPLCAIYPPDTFDLAQRHLRSQSRSPAHLLDTLASLGRVRALSPSKDATDSLRSWNRPEDVGAVLDPLL